LRHVKRHHLEGVGRVGKVGRLGRLAALVRYFRDPSASMFGKLFVLAAALYVVWPMDLIPDVPLIGWLDDLGVAGVAMAFLAKVAGRYRADVVVEPQDRARLSTT
jgi:uncharacterized membrane protein YkvA (DUF1232 family)